MKLTCSRTACRGVPVVKSGESFICSRCGREAIQTLDTHKRFEEMTQAELMAALNAASETLLASIGPDKQFVLVMMDGESKVARCVANIMWKDAANVMREFSECIAVEGSRN